MFNVSFLIFMFLCFSLIYNMYLPYMRSAIESEIWKQFLGRHSVNIVEALYTAQQIFGFLFLASLSNGSCVGTRFGAVNCFNLI